MWKAAVVMLIAFVAFVGTTLEWGQTLDGRDDDPCVVQGVDLCEDDDPVTTTTASTTTAPTTTTAPPTTATVPTTLP